MSTWLNRFNLPLLTRLCAISLLARWGFLWLAQPHIHAVEDFNIAQHLAHGDGFAYGGFENDWHLTALKAPVYPLFLAVFVVLFSESAKLAVALVQHALFAFLPIFFLRIGKALEIELLGKLAALLFLVHPSYLYYPTVIEATNLFVPLSMLWLEWLIGVIKSAVNARMLMLFGLLSGTLVLTQPTALVPIAFCLALMLMLGARIKSLALIFALMLLPIAIWTARNWLVFEKVIPIKSPFYMNLYVGLLPDYTGLKQFEFLDSEKIQQLNALHQKLSDVAMEAHYKSAFLEAVQAKPMLYAQKTLWQAVLYWLFPPRYFEQLSLQFWLVRILPVAFLNVFFILGMMRLWKLHRGFALALLLTLSYFTLVYALTHVANIRFKLDIEWLELYACAAVLQPRN
jgi:hypothetical protein